ncbi:MAG: inositol monophosphatase family protein [Chloroflexota bacterium]
MGINSELPGIVIRVISIVESIIAVYSQRLIESAVNGVYGEIRNHRHEDNFLSVNDLEIHTLYFDEFSKVFSSFVYASEEDDPRLYGSTRHRTPEYVVLVDPLDTSELAVRGLSGYTQVIIFSANSHEPILSVVGDIFHEINIFCAYRTSDGRNRAFLKTRSGKVLSISSSANTRLADALITNYLMKPTDRFAALSNETELLGALGAADTEGSRRGRIGVDFGSIGFCHVAAGFTDAFIEVAKGFSLWDLLPGQYILQAAGGLVSSLSGTLLPCRLSTADPVALTRQMNMRQKFVAAGNPAMLKCILDSIAAED